MKKLFTLGIALAFACAAYAYPTLTGPTGLATLPTAAVAPAGQLQIAADYYDTEGDSTIPLRVLYGVGGNLEFGLLYAFSNQSMVLEVEDDFALTFDADNTWGLNAKYALPVDLAGFQFAAGAQYLTSDFAVTVVDLLGEFPTEELASIDTNTTQVYLVGTRAFTLGGDGSPALNGTLGLNWTRMKLDLTGEEIVPESISESGFRFFGGLEALFANNLSLAVEFQTEEEDLGDTDMLWSFVGRYPFTPSLSAQIGYTNASNIPAMFEGELGITMLGLNGGGEHNFFAGLNFAWDGTE